ncbi:hypothetical protein [Mucilaginibacter sp. FT3.2]|uniref:hypothetical protein n=1 Tax=Mucilaginibacter sp. FT3.2 TaxID=2723090 RepID=UPI001614FA71|nr:hypothetical protein [Mucilaginibacter sp. FT3.2]MBB6235274.1 YD repeat-containing protein [Mucilaginibacter sp. FT3.2]
MKITQRSLRLSFVILLLVCNLHTFAQQFKFTDYVPSSPKSPQAAALGQYGDVPVSLYTGVPNIQIPIYEIKVGKFSLPISLSYHASGVKVEDYPSWVGTGWTLNAAGVINRQQRGVNDEFMIDNYPTYQSQVATILASSVSNSLGYTNTQAPLTSSDGMFQGNYDTESDIFNCMLPGGSSKFYLDVAGNAHAMPANKLMIQPVGRILPASTARIRCFNQWVVTDNDGTKYLYGSANNINTFEVVTPESYYTTETLPESIINSWYLAEIDLTNGQKINFNYETYNYSTVSTGDQTFFWDSRINESAGSGQFNYLNFTTALRLANITYPGGKVEFVAGSNRADLPQDKVLDRINIYNEIGSNYNLLKTFKIITNNPANISPAPLTNLSNSFRLNLQGVEMYDNLQKKIGKYSMTYDPTTTSLPRDAPIDYWGYYRGTGLPDPVSYFSTTSDTYQKLSAAPGRPVNSSFTQFDILTQIVYPTGGYSNFTYENNDAIPNDTTILDFIGNLISNPVNRTTEYDIPNDASRAATGFGPEFTVGNTAQGATFQFTLHELSNDGNTCTTLTQCFSNNLWRKNTDGTWTNLGGSTVTIEPNTTYKIQIVWHSSYQGVAYAIYTWQEVPVISPATIPTFNVGGLRIKNIQSYDPVTLATINKSYEYKTDAGGTSGVVAAVPVYSYTFPLIIMGHVDYYKVHTNSSKNQSSLFGSSGAEVGYSQVTEYIGSGGEAGKTVYKYTSNDTSIPGGYPDGGIAASFVWPFPPANSYEWRRGNLLSKYTYVNKNSIYQPVSKIDNTYHFFADSDLNYQLNTNIKILQNEVNIIGDPVYQFVYQHDYLKYNTSSESYFTASTTTQDFDSQNNTVFTSTSTSNSFDPVSLENSSSASVKSNGDIFTQQIQYIANYNSANAVDDAALGIKNMIFSNQVKAPVEQLNIVRNRQTGLSYVTGGSLFFYYKDKPLIKDYYSLKLDTPVLLTAFVKSSINGSGQFVYDSKYELNTTSAYNTAYNIDQITKNGIRSTVYQWGYNEQYPVAQAANAKSNDVFYDSFEEGNGNSALNDSKTGHYSYNGSTTPYTKALSDLDAGSYTLSYWQKSGSTWLLIITPVTVTGNSYTITLSEQIDDVRIYPVDAQMSTYTYDPLVGITSATDAKNQTTYYEYDGFQRLINIRDKDLNIVKHTDYHYQGQ